MTTTEGPNDISVIIFFCTLREILLDNLINNMVKAENLSEGVVERLLSDNKFHIQKQDKLFKSLTGIKWKQAIEKISEGEKTDFCNVNNFVVDVVRARNRFIHEGSKWLIDRELSTNCMKNLNALIKKYIRLNNQYVCPYYQKNL